MKTGTKSIFALFLCMIILLLPMTAMAVGEFESPLEGLTDLLTPETGVWWSFVIVAGIIAADTLFGIFLGLKRKEFDVRILPQFLLTGVAPFLGGLLVLAILAYLITPFAGMFFAAAVFIVGKYAKDLVEKFKILFTAAPQ